MATDYLGGMQKAQGATPGQFGDYSGVTKLGSGLSSAGDAMMQYEAVRKSKEDKLNAYALENAMYKYTAEQDQNPENKEAWADQDMDSMQDNFVEGFFQRAGDYGIDIETYSPELLDRARASLNNTALTRKVSADADRRITRTKQALTDIVERIGVQPSTAGAQVGEFFTWGMDLTEDHTSTAEKAFNERARKLTTDATIDWFLNQPAKIDDTSKAFDAFVAEMFPEDAPELRAYAREEFARRSKAFRKTNDMTKSELNAAITEASTTGVISPAALAKASVSQLEQLEVSADEGLFKQTLDAFYGSAYADLEGAAVTPYAFMKSLVKMTPDEAAEWAAREGLLTKQSPDRRASLLKGAQAEAAEILEQAKTGGAVKLFREMGNTEWDAIEKTYPLVDDNGFSEENAKIQRTKAIEILRNQGAEEVPVILGLDYLTEVSTSAKSTPDEIASALVGFNLLNKGYVGYTAQQYAESISSIKSPEERETAEKSFSFMAPMLMGLEPESEQYVRYIRAQKVDLASVSPEKQKALRDVKKAYADTLSSGDFPEEMADFAKKIQIASNGDPNISNRMADAFFKYAMFSSNSSVPPTTSETIRSMNNFLSDVMIVDNDGNQADSTLISTQEIYSMKAGAFSYLGRWLGGEYSAMTRDERKELAGIALPNVLFALAAGNHDIEPLYGEFFPPFRLAYQKGSDMAHSFLIGGYAGGKYDRSVYKLMKNGRITGNLTGIRWGACVNGPKDVGTEDVSGDRDFMLENMRFRAIAVKTFFYDKGEDGRRIGTFKRWYDPETGEDFFVPAVRDTLSKTGVRILVDKQGAPIWKLSTTQALSAAQASWRVRKRGFFRDFHPKILRAAGRALTNWEGNNLVIAPPSGKSIFDEEREFWESIPTIEISQ